MRSLSVTPEVSLDSPGATLPIRGKARVSKLGE